MNSISARTAALILHAIASFLLVNYLLRYDITAHWASFIGFVALCMALLFLFLRHALGFVFYLKNKSK